VHLNHASASSVLEKSTLVVLSILEGRSGAGVLLGWMAKKRKVWRCRTVVTGCIFNVVLNISYRALGD